MIGVEGAKATGNILSKCDNLTYFRYEGCRPQPEGTDGIVGGLASVVRRNKSHPLEVIELDGTMHGESVESFCNDVLNTRVNKFNITRPTWIVLFGTECQQMSVSSTPMLTCLKTLFTFIN